MPSSSFTWFSFSFFFRILSAPFQLFLQAPTESVKFILGEGDLGWWKNGILSAAAEAPVQGVRHLPAHLFWLRRGQAGWTFFPALDSIEVDGTLLISITGLIGCILLSVGQDEFHGEALHTLNYVLNQSDYTVQTLRNVTGFLSLAKTVHVTQVFLPLDVKDDIDKLNAVVNTAAETLWEKTNENSVKIRRVFDSVRLALTAVAAVMILVSILGLIVSILGHQHAIHMFIISGWLLVAVTFILCGVFVVLNNTVSDTCMGRVGGSSPSRNCP